MATAVEWLCTAKDGLRAARECAEQGRWRSACSRSYYAAHNAAHAVVAHFDPAVSDQPRSIAHGELPAALFRSAKKVSSRAFADTLRVGLTEAYNARVTSDYRPQDIVDSEAYSSAHAAAARLVTFAQRLQA